MKTPILGFVVVILIIAGISYYFETSLYPENSLKAKSGIIIQENDRVDLEKNQKFVQDQNSIVDKVEEITVTKYNKEKVEDGYNLVNGILFTMDGSFVAKLKGHVFQIFDDGSYLSAFNQSRISMFDSNHSLMWNLNIVNHHELIASESGTVYTIGKEIIAHKNTTVGFDTIIKYIVSENSSIVWSTYENKDHIARFHEKRTLDQVISSNEDCKFGPYTGACFDYYHINSIHPLPDNNLEDYDSRFRKGNLLVSYSFFDMMAIQDKDSLEILWTWRENELSFIHTPRMLGNGNILVFENGVKDESSRVLEIDPSSKEIVWEYIADPPTSFYTKNGGSSQRLDNGNTLIAESAKGRAFEITPAGEIVWEVLLPIHKPGYRLYRISRISEEVVEKIVLN